MAVNLNSEPELERSAYICVGRMIQLDPRIITDVDDGFDDKAATSCYRWARMRRVIHDIETNEIGKYSARLHPWVEELHNSEAPYHWILKGAQLGLTEWAINIALYMIDKLRKDVLYVLPTGTAASDLSKARFGGALSLSPYLKSLFTDTDSVNLKQAGSRTLYIRGAGGKGNLFSVPVSCLILDELDRMDPEQIWLALERLSGQIQKMVRGLSTPTIPNFGIHKLFLTGTQEEFVFKCPRCGRRTFFEWPDCVEIIGEHTTDKRCAESYLKCRECKGKIDQREKPEFLKTGLFIPQNENANPEVRSSHVSQLYSFTVTPGELVVAHFRGFGDEMAEIEFHNSKLGLPFIGDGARVDEAMIERALGTHTKDDDRPSHAGRIITMGVDRGKFNYAVVCEYFFDRWSLDVNVAAKCKVLYEIVFPESDFDRTVDQLMSEWQVLCCVTDADPGPNEARRFARRFNAAGDFVYLCRYRRGVTAKEIALSEQDTGASMATVDRSNWLSASLGRFKSDPSRIILPRDVSSKFCEHMGNLTGTFQRDETGNPNLVFVETGADHFAHALTYCELALPLVGFSQGNLDIGKLL